MVEKSARKHALPRPPRPTGWRCVLYWCGRGLQLVGLLLVWWILLLFTSVTGMQVLLRGVLLAAVVFYAGWACTAWAKKGF